MRQWMPASIRLLLFTLLPVRLHYLYVSVDKPPSLAISTCRGS